MPSEPRVVAVLDADFEGIESIIRGITELRLAAEICIQNPSPALRSLLVGRGLKVSDAALPKKRSIANATIVVHHGDLPVVELAVAAGRPQIVVPRWRGQHWYASMIADRRIGVRLMMADEWRDMGNVCRLFIENDVVGARALAWAKTMAEDFGRPGADTVVKKCLELLG